MPLSVGKVQGSIPGPVKLDIELQLANVSTPLRRFFGAVLPGANLQRRAPPLVTRFGEIQYCVDLKCFRLSNNETTVETVLSIDFLDKLFTKTESKVFSIS